jgi:NADH:ubiquinone oxidoreductase subunit 6 (subunit J)
VSHCFHSFLEFVYQHFPPGVLTVILAVLAVVTALPAVTRKLDPEKAKRWRWAHAAAIFVFCSIAALEMAVINHANKVSEKRISDLQQKIEIAVSNTTTIQGELTGFIRSESIASQARTESMSHHKISDELLQLKGRTASLAAD